MLLSLAQDAVNWGEGADFEMKELIQEADQATTEALKTHYPEFFAKNLEESDYPDTDAGYDELEAAQDWASKEGCWSNKFYNQIRSDINILLMHLITKEQPINHIKVMSKAIDVIYQLTIAAVIFIVLWIIGFSLASYSNIVE